MQFSSDDMIRPHTSRIRSKPMPTVHPISSKAEIGCVYFLSLLPAGRLVLVSNLPSAGSLLLNSFTKNVCFRADGIRCSLVAPNLAYHLNSSLGGEGGDDNSILREIDEQGDVVSDPAGLWDSFKLIFLKALCIHWKLYPWCSLLHEMN